MPDRDLPAYTIHHIQLYNGCRVAYTDEGAGSQTILFIHGLATYGKSWMRNMEALKKNSRCIAIDLPGNGYSDGGDYPYTMAFFARSIIDFIGRLKLTNVCLAGHSMGGQIALTMLTEAPGCAERLLLCAPAGFEHFTDSDRMLYQQALQYSSWFSDDENSLRQTLRNSFYRFPQSAAVMVEELVKLMRAQPAVKYRKMIDHCVQAMLAEPVYASLSSIKQPTLILFGEQDALIPNKLLHPQSTRQVAEAGARALPNATLRLIPRCGHFLQWEKAEPVNGWVDKWLKG